MSLVHFNIALYIMRGNLSTVLYEYTISIGLPYTQIVNYQDNFFFWIESPSNLSYNTLIIQLGGRVNADEYKKIITEKILTGVDENGEAVFAKMRQVLITI